MPRTARQILHSREDRVVLPPCSVWRRRRVVGGRRSGRGHPLGDGIARAAVLETSPWSATTLVQFCVSNNIVIHHTFSHLLPFNSHITLLSWHLKFQRLLHCSFPFALVFPFLTVFVCPRIAACSRRNFLRYLSFLKSSSHGVSDFQIEFPPLPDSLSLFNLILRSDSSGAPYNINAVAIFVSESKRHRFSLFGALYLLNSHGVFL